MHASPVIALASLLVASLVGPVHAAEPPATPDTTLAEVCTEQGVFAAEVATMRDAGIPEDAVLKGVQSTGRQVLPGVDMAVHDAVTARLMALVRQIYADPGRTPEQARVMAEQDCLKTVAPQ